MARSKLVKDRDLELVWSSRWSLSVRILAVNIIALALLAGGFFYLDTYRSRLIDQRTAEESVRVSLIAEAVDAVRERDRQALITRLGRSTDQRVRIFGRDGGVVADSWALGEPTYTLRDPASEPWQRHVARLMDRIIDFIVFADRPAPFAEPSPDRLSAWPEAIQALRDRAVLTQVRLAPDRTLVLSAARPVGDGVVLITGNARDITRIVRAERYRLGIVLGIVILISVLLSLFLARTIVRPLRRLAIAAQRVRLGRAREVQVPRLPSRRDEIGLLARALSDMSQTLRQRIDATEAFAADVTHELKNPLASLRSAVDSLDRVAQPELRGQLAEVIRDDVNRLDRLVSDIAEASRVDAEMARASFETVDVGEMIAGLVAAREVRASERQDVRLAYARPNAGSSVVLGDGSRLTRVVENLIDNALSFSPPDGLVQISATRDGEIIQVTVEDEGPGVPADMRDTIFRRFHSVRPEQEAFGRHSGLGLAIAKAIVEAHHGMIRVEDREHGESGARFVIRLPAANP